MLMERKVVSVVLIILVLFSFMSVVHAEKVTVSLRNAKMVLRLDAGETIERGVGVINTNDFSVNVEVTADGDLVNDMEIKDGKFILAAGEERKVYFTLTAPNSAGITESKVLVKFLPEEGNGVATASQIVVIVGANGEDFSIKTILIISSALLVLVLIVLAYFAFKAGGKKRSGRPRE